MYIHQEKDWPHFVYSLDRVSNLLQEIRFNQGKLLGKMEGVGFEMQDEANIKTLTLDVVKSSEIEGELLNSDQVRSSLARKLGMTIPEFVPSDRNVDGIVEIMIDATQKFLNPLTAERMFGWHGALFPTGRSGLYKIVSGNWRKNEKDSPMQVVSGVIGKERVHFEASDSVTLKHEMALFIEWFNNENSLDPILKAAISHLWFVTIHPFDDGNGRIARAISDMQLARSDKSNQRFYSMSAQIRVERNGYYNILEKTQRGNLDITEWIIWFLECLGRSIRASEEILSVVLQKASFWDKHSSLNLNERQRMMINKLFDGFEGKLNSSKWAQITKRSSDTALRDIEDLIDKGILVKEDGGGRSTSYVLFSGNKRGDC